MTIGRAGDRATSVTFTRSGRRVVAGSQDRTALVWDLARPGTAPLVLRGQEGVVVTVAAGADEHVATAGSGGTARIWDARSGRLLFTLQGHTGLVVRARFSPDGARLATAANDGTARVWDARTGGLRAVLAGHRSNVRDVAFAPDAATVATGAFDGTARLWDVTRGGSAADLVDHRGAVTGVAFMGSSGGVVTAAHDGTIDVWRRGQQQPVRRIRAAGAPIQAAAVDATGEYVAAGDHNGQGALWEVRTGRRLLSLPATAGIVYAVGFDRAGLRLATVGEGGVTLASRRAGGWSEASARLLSGAEARGLALAFDRAGAKLATAGVDGRIRVWSTGAEARPRVWRDQEGVLFDTEFSPDDALLASGGRDGSCGCATPARAPCASSASRPRRSRRRRALQPHRRPHRCSASQDGTAVIWRVAEAGGWRS